MKIMGVDPSISCTGFSLPDGYTLPVKPRSKGDDRLEEIADHLHALAVDQVVDLVVMEGLFGVYKGEAARVIPMLHGALRLELKRLKIPYMVLNPTTLKRFATGSPSADKTAMQLAALKRLDREYVTSDECDADWCRIAGRFVYGLGHLQRPDGGLVIMPRAQVDALRKGLKGAPLVWPVVQGLAPWPSVERSVVYVDEGQPHAPGRAVLCGPCARLGHSVCR